MDNKDNTSLLDHPDLTKRLGIAAFVRDGAWLEALEALMPHLYPEEARQADAMRLRDAILEKIMEGIRSSKAPPKHPMKFGTSGWRGHLLEDFTTHNVGCVTQALVDVLTRPEFACICGAEDVAELKKRGVMLAHDTRIAGEDFVETAARVLMHHGFNVTALGMATTPEVSAALTEKGGAFSINFTPSHNPFQWHGYKFNPADGGPAPSELTGPVAERANRIFAAGSGFAAVDAGLLAERRRSGRGYSEADPIELYRRALRRRAPYVDLERIVNGLNEKGIHLYIDNGFGAASGKYERLLSGIRPNLLHIVHGGRDPLFGGRSQEPSPENFARLQKRMSGTAPCLGIINDGDGDRFIGGGRKAILVMNRFGPLVVRFLTEVHGVRGDVTRSVMTSHMADAARARYLPQGRLNETKVGFQHMRPAIPRSVNSWEESDGMSPHGWLLDKDGLMAALLLMEMVLHYDASPEALLETLESELGHYFFQRTKVPGPLAGSALREALHGRFASLEPGSTIDIAGRSFVVRERVHIDGVKVIFDEGWWFGVRPSGTEPVVRPYVETFAPPGASPHEISDAQAWKERILEWLVGEITIAVGG